LRRRPRNRCAFANQRSWINHGGTGGRETHKDPSILDFLRVRCKGDLDH
jgi:hypothetical protein